MAILADPLPQGARAISFAPFHPLTTPPHCTRVVLVLLSGVANPLAVLIPRRMRRSIHELVDCTNHILLCLFLLGKIMVLNQLPFKLMSKLLESGDRIRATKEAVNEENIHLRDRKYKRDNTNLPACCCDGVLNGGERVTEVVVIINGMTILIVPVVWHWELEALTTLNPVFGPRPRLHFARIVRNQRPSRRHHFHYVTGLL